MKEFPRGGLLGKAVFALRRLQSMQIGVYGANACFFMVLAGFPALLLLLELLRRTPFGVEQLGESLRFVLPEAFLAEAEELILLTYDSSGGAVVGISTLTALWSAGRGIHGILTGLNAVYGVQETRGWFLTRLISTGFTFAFLLVLAGTLSLQVFGRKLLGILNRANPFWGFLAELIDLRFFLLLILQSAVFAAMFQVLPNRTGTFRRSLPGAVLASLGWLGFSWLYSWYVERFGHLSDVYGSLSALALSLLWLYGCMCLFFFGGAVNAALEPKK